MTTYKFVVITPEGDVVADLGTFVMCPGLGGVLYEVLNDWHAENPGHVETTKAQLIPIH